MSKPSEITVATPATVKVEKKERPKSEPVRNPAFRESEPLRELQKRLHAEERRRPSSRKNK